MTRTIKSIHVDGEDLQYDYSGLANAPTVDSELSSTSENPVQNKVVKSGLDNKVNRYEASYNCIKVTPLECLSPDERAISASPLARDFWHDQFAFLRNHSIYKQEISSDGSTWTDGEIDNIKNLFCQKEKSSINILTPDNCGYRITIYSNMFHTCQIKWMEFNASWVSAFMQTQVTVEVSEDGETWVANDLIANISAPANPYFLPINVDWTSQCYVRITFIGTTNIGSGYLPLVNIKAFTYRKGQQGLGIENEKPYDWNADGDILPISTGVQSLGTSDKQWNNLYVKNIYVNKNGLSSVAISGSYNDLTDKPTIPEADNKYPIVYKYSTDTKLDRAINITNGSNNILSKELPLNSNGGGVFWADPNEELSFNNSYSLSSIDLSRINYRPTTTNKMFKYCSTLKTLDLHFLDTSNVTEMKEMFSWCLYLENIDLSTFDTSNVTNMHGMFFKCRKLGETLDLSNFNTSKVTDFGEMFSNCNNLTYLDLSSFDTTNLIDGGMISMFFGTNISKLTLSSSFFNSTALTEYDFSGLTAWTDTESLANFVTVLPTITTTKTLELSSNTKSALTADQTSTITTKGWTIIA